MQHPATFVSEKLFSVPTSDLCKRLTKAASVSASQAMRCLIQLCYKRLQTKQTSAMIACHIFAPHYTLSVNSVGDSSRFTRLSGYERVWTAEPLVHWLRIYKGVLPLRLELTKAKQHSTARAHTTRMLGGVFQRLLVAEERRWHSGWRLWLREI